MQWLQEVGPVEHGPNGPMALTWQELNAWKQATGTEATGEEMAMLRQLSRDYVSQYRAGEDPNMPPPVRRKNTGKVDMSSQFKGVLSSHAAGRKKNRRR